MKKEEILKMEAGRELDILILKTIWGVKKIHYWEWDKDKSKPQYIPSNKPWRTHQIDARSVPSFSNEIYPAFLIVEKLDGCLHLKQHGKKGIWEALFCEAGPEHEASGKTAPLAICRAALLAVSERKEG